MQTIEGAHEEEAGLVRRAQAADADAFGLLVDRYMRRACAAALALVNAREDALDLGLVYGNTIRARHLGKDILAGLKGVVGGEVQEYTKLFAESSEQAIDRMTVQAAGRGANAVVCVQFTTSYIMGNASEILAYGEAVVVEAE